MKDCCAAAAEEYCFVQSPFGPSLKEDFLCAHLLQVAKKWGGEPLRAITDSLYIRTVPTHSFFDAKVAAISCKGNHIVNVVLIGARLFYFIWRTNIICSTFFEGAPSRRDERTQSIGRESGAPWPTETEIQQFKLAITCYFEDAFLSNVGFDYLKELALRTDKSVWFLTDAISDLSLLFILLHELHHLLPQDPAFDAGGGSRIQLPPDLKLSEKRRERWQRELSNDANAARILWMTTASELHKKGTFSQEDAITQAASLVFTAVDATLHILQFAEELQRGKVALDDAVVQREFARHPPSSYRRDVNSQFAYSQVTGKSYANLLRRDFTPRWDFVVQNVLTFMKIRDTLFGKILHP